MIDPFRLCLALGPVAVYLLLLAMLNIFRRPFLVSGTRDAATLGLAVSGLVMVGPMELFMPVPALIAFGAYIWALAIALYVLCLVLILLVQRPRLVVYNISTDELRPVLADLVHELDGEARWAGDSVFLPNLGIQFQLEGPNPMRNVSLQAIGSKQNPQGWRKLESTLRGALRGMEVPRNSRAVSLFSAGLLLSLGLVLIVARDPQSVTQALATVGRSVVEILPWVEKVLPL